jgi:hypothetical protein
MPRPEIVLRRDQPEAGTDAKAALGAALAKREAQKKKERLRLTLLIVGGAIFLGIVWLILWKLVYSIDSSLNNLDHNLKLYKAQDNGGDDANDGLPSGAATPAHAVAPKPATPAAAAP